MSTVAFHTLGCKLNFSETSSIGRQFDAAGYSRVPFHEKADVYVINTCSVTANADKECRSIVNSAMTANPQGFVVIVGCYAQLKPEEICAIPGVDLVLGAAEKFSILDFLKTEKLGSAEMHHCDIASVDAFVPTFSSGDRTRSFLKAQDGCDYSCTFCTIPLARGKSRSGTVEDITAAARKLIASGVREIVLTGINLGDFGHGPRPTTKKAAREERFADLIESLDTIEGECRFRISSIEPNLLSDRIIAFVASSRRFVPHFHIPLQSGSNVVLARMKRRYRRELFAGRIAQIRQQMPDACIGADVIVGFPGETEEHFLETVNFIRDLDLSYLHVFTYSERDNTEAALMDGTVAPAVRKQRNKILRNLSEKKLRAFYERFAGSERPVLFESELRGDRMHGYTDNYIRVSAPFDPTATGRIVVSRLGEIQKDGTVMADAVAQEAPL